jgi:hypothetical protein
MTNSNNTDNTDTTEPTNDREAVLSRLGRRARRFIADAQEGDDLTGSLLTFKPTTGELLRWRKEGLIRGGFNRQGTRNGDPIVCAI